MLVSFWVSPGETIVARNMMGDLTSFTSCGQYHALRKVIDPQVSLSSGSRPLTLVPCDGGWAPARAVGAMPRPKGGESRPCFLESFPVAIVDAQNVVAHALGVFLTMEQNSAGGEQT